VTTWRLAMSSYYLPSQSKIGSGFMAHRLAQVMVRRGHHVTMFSPCPRPDDASYDHVALPLTGAGRTFRWAGSVRQLDLSGFDVFHAHGDDYLRRGRSTPAHVRTMHGSCFSEAVHIHGLKERARMAVLGASEVVATGVADETVLVSRNSGRWFPWVHRVIPNGVDTHRFHPGEKERTPTILFVGTYLQRKRGRMLMEAFAEHVRPVLPKARLWMVCGDAPKAPGVEVLGRLDEDELADRYRRAWVFCLPSTYEGFGVPYIEAMASGTAVVATPNPGAREVLADGRFGRITRDELLGTALVNLLRDEVARLDLARRGRQRAVYYDWDRVASAYEDLYAEIIDRS
jgi:phosphatidyl-myo-inositol alpha-mannosyltransferase